MLNLSRQKEINPLLYDLIILTETQLVIINTLQINQTLL